MRIIIVAALGVALLVPAAAGAASGITPLSPKNNATIDAGSRLSFILRVKGTGSVWVHVSKSRKKRKNGTIANDVWIGQAKKKGAKFVAKVKFFDFPEFWLNTPGTYYWQAHRIKCESGTSDCAQEGPIYRLRIR